jgi:hypothetical protein
VLESVGLTEAAVESEEGAVQDDGFMISLALSIFERALGPRLDPNCLVIVVCDLTALPDRFKPFQALRGDRMGVRIQFPSEWLALPLDESTAPFGDGKPDDGTAAPDFLAGFRSLLRHHIGCGGLSAETAAALVAMSRWNGLSKPQLLTTCLGVN